MSAEKGRTSNSNHGDTNWIFAIWLALTLGLLAIILLGINNATFGRLGAVTGGLMLAGASGLLGGFLGFLFGIPRSQQIVAAPTSGDNSSDRQYLENTNLEQISDWLTKIIVGITLIQYQTIENTITKVGMKFGPVLLSHEQPGISQAIAVACIVYFLVVGFLFAYLWTRVYMEFVLRKQRALANSEIEDMWEKRAQEESDTDAAAFELVDAYLDKNSNPTDDKFIDIEAKIAKSSLIARTLIFEKARDVRRKNWRESGDREMVDRTVTIFRGLTVGSPDKYHRNYGQLGYALVKATRPNWIAAKSALEKAISLRGSGNQSGASYYEFNLAIVLINLDQSFKAEKKSDDETRKSIASLLDTGRLVIDLSDEPVIIKWAKLNGYKI